VIYTVLVEGNLIYGIHYKFVGGTDSTSATMVWAMLYMAVYPEIQAKIHKEIDKVIGKTKNSEVFGKLIAIHILLTSFCCKSWKCMLKFFGTNRCSVLKFGALIEIKSPKLPFNSIVLVFSSRWPHPSWTMVELSEPTKR